MLFRNIRANVAGRRGCSFSQRARAGARFTNPHEDASTQRKICEPSGSSSLSHHSCGSVERVTESSKASSISDSPWLRTKRSSVRLMNFTGSLAHASQSDGFAIPSSTRIVAKRADAASLTNGEERPYRAVARPGCAPVQLARGHKPGRCLRGRPLSAVGVVLECLREDVAALLELRTLLKLPNDFAGLTGVAFNHSPKPF